MTTSASVELTYSTLVSSDTNYRKHNLILNSQRIDVTVTLRQGPVLNSSRCQLRKSAMLFRGAEISSDDIGSGTLTHLHEALRYAKQQSAHKLELSLA